MIDSPIRFALIGSGGIAQTHIQAFAKNGLARLVAVADLRRESAEAVGAAVQCRAFGSAEELLSSDCEVDAAIVCTPPNTHATICGQLSDAGVHVLCEKPIALDLGEATKMIEHADRNNTILTMASKFRYTSDMIYAKQLVTSGVLGEVLLFENTFAGHVDMSKRWNSNRTISGGGVLIDNGTHSVDIVRYLLGPLSSIQVIEGKRYQSIQVEDTVRIHAKTDCGALAAMDLSWSINKQTPWYVSIYGSQGTVLVGWKESKYKRAIDSEWTVFGSGYDKVQAFTSQLNNFCNALRGIEPLLITSQDALASADAIDKAYESMKTDGWVAVDNYPLIAGRIAS
ncbi:MAG: Gfo/Idh/MocA family oxidoreductase [Pirellula sp.]|jgi:predicted dehydrogenase|nr:Gfo/Idh/MocA family oxidoreductase [Pirellula sp.]